MGTKYNVLYNGNIALESGIEGVNDAYSENFWEILPVERMQVTDEIQKPGESKNADFERAEEKAIKAVQTHDMVIKGKEKPANWWSLFALGTSQILRSAFYSGARSVQLYSFKYPTSDKINTAKVWREKLILG